MNVVGVDLSLTQSGLARPDGTLATLTLERRLKGYHRHPAMVSAMAAAVHACAPDLVIIEGYDPHPRGPLALIRGAEVGGMFRVWLTRTGIDFVEVAPAALKKFATGKGNANKDAVLAAATAEGAATLTYDEADAYWLRRYGLEHSTARPDQPIRK